MTGEPTAEMIRQAAFWAAELATDEATPADRAACEAWCRDHPLHRLAMDRMQSLDQRFDRTEAAERNAIDRLLPAGRQRPRRIGMALGCGAALLLAGGMAAQSWTVRSLFPGAATVRGEQRSLTVNDGDLMLDTDSAVRVDRQDGGTHVALYRGRVLAHVTPGRKAPFRVETPEGTASALGTAFVVEQTAGRTTVTVISSHVRACTGRDRASCMDLSPGQRVTMDGRRLFPLVDVAPKAAAAWSEGWLIANDRPVTDILAEINRYRQNPVAFDAAALRDVHVSGSFPLADTDRALKAIAKVTGLSLDRDGDMVEIRHR